MSKKDSKESTQPEAKLSRRNFLGAAAAATATGAASLGFPSIAKAQAPISLRFQSTWPAEQIAERVLGIEHQLLPYVIEKIALGKVFVENNRVRVGT